MFISRSLKRTLNISTKCSVQLQCCFTTSKDDLHPETASLRLGYRPEKTSIKAIKAPVYLSSTFVFENAETGADAFGQVYGLDGKHASLSTPYIYSRVTNPNLMIFEERLAFWDEFNHCLLFSSGMSAISTLFHSLLKPGDHMIITNPVYGGTHALAEHILPLYGIHAHFVDAGNDCINQIDNLINDRSKIDDINKLKLIFAETPSNPSITHTDIQELANITQKINQKRNNNEKNDKNEEKCFLVVDNTFLGPVFQTPSKHGADATLYSATKFLGGHSDLIAGSISCSNEYLFDQLTLYRTLMGTMSQPFISWLLIRSLETLSIRMRQANENAKELATNVLNKHSAVTNIRYSTLLETNSTQDKIFKQQCLEPGSLIAFDIIGDKKDAYKVLDNLEVFSLAVSLGGTESLVEHPQSMTHADCDPSDLDKQGINERTIRMSVGIENVQDLRKDLIQALNCITNDKMKI